MMLIYEFYANLQIANTYSQFAKLALYSHRIGII